MIDWALKLRIGKGVADRAGEIVQKLDRGERVHRAYLLTLARNENDALDILPAWEVKEQEAAGRLPKVIGLAASKKEAMRLVEQLAKECFLKHGKLSLRRYLLEAEGEA